jgi:hydroxypyruvate isomerase
MDRRTFVKTCAATAGATTLLRSAAAKAEVQKGLFTDSPINLSMPFGWFPGGSMDEKLASLAEWGFHAYEWLGPNGDIDALKAKMDELKLELSCITGAGAIAPGGMVQPEDHDKVVEQFKGNVELAHKLGCKTIIALTGNERSDVSREQQNEYVVTCLKRLAPIAEAENVTIALELLNVLVDHKGYFLVTTPHAVELLQAVNSPNVKMCFDIYHQQISEGNVTRNLTGNIERVGHIHVGDNPGRKQPGTGELNYKNIFKAVHEAGYDRFVTLECGKQGPLEDALAYLHDCVTW